MSPAEQLNSDQIHSIISEKKQRKPMKLLL